jgi:hypothetical protein
MKKFFFVFIFAFAIAAAGYGIAQYVNANGVTANACNSGCD